MTTYTWPIPETALGKGHFKKVILCQCRMNKKSLESFLPPVFKTLNINNLFQQDICFKLTWKTT